MIPIDEHEKLWIEMSPEDSSYESAIKYFKTRMYVKRDMEPSTKLKELRETANVLWSYRNQVVGMDTGDRAARVSHAGITIDWTKFQLNIIIISIPIVIYYFKL